MLLFGLTYAVIFNKNSLSSGLHSSRDRCDDRCTAQMGRKMLVEDWLNRSVVVDMPAKYREGVAALHQGDFFLSMAAYKLCVSSLSAVSDGKKFGDTDIK